MKGRRDSVRRNTSQRGAILHVLAKAGCHLTAEEVFRRTRRARPRIGLATVYRALELFTRAGLLEPAHFADGRVRFGLSAKHHDHALCLSCGEWEPLADCVVPRPPGRTPPGFRVTGHQLEVFGYCAACQAAGP